MWRHQEGTKTPVGSDSSAEHSRRCALPGVHVPAELPDSAEFTFNATLIPESGLLEAAESSNASWSGVYLHDRTDPAGPLADKLLCNGTHNLAAASTIQGNLSVVLTPAEGSNNASATIATLGPGTLIRLSSLWIVSLKVCSATRKVFLVTALACMQSTTASLTACL